jgi:CheY-like chemotaxis protein
VIQNIIINAVQAMPGGGEISISTEDEIFDGRNFIKIIIRDEGVGIPEEYLMKIFDPYFTTKSTGTGLGLSVCHSIVKHHDGKMRVVSEPNKGTAFEILLPASQVKLDSSGKEQNLKMKRLSVLIMDDDEDILDLLQGMLLHLGHEVSSSSDGHHAIRILKDRIAEKKHFDLAILDYTIKGGMGGLDTAIQLKKMDSDLKIVISSGYLDTSIKEKVKDESIALLDKPYSLSKLREKLSSLFIDQ